LEVDDRNLLSDTIREFICSVRGYGGRSQLRIRQPEYKCQMYITSSYGVQRTIEKVSKESLIIIYSFCWRECRYILGRTNLKEFFKSCYL
jgi:hypothetical protein